MIEIHRAVPWDVPISSPYGPRKNPHTGAPGSFHYGIDFAAPEGTPVVASVTGRIVLAGWENEDDKSQGFGFRVWQYEERRDIFVCYAHLSEITVKQGDEVVAGTRVGLSGNTGSSTGPHLHQEVRPEGIAGKRGIDFSFILPKGIGG